MALVDQPLEQRLAVGVRHDGLRRELTTVGSAHAGRTAVGDDDLRHRGIGLYLEAEALSGSRDRLRDAAHAAFDEAPAAGTGMLAHDVMHDDIGGTRRFRPGEGSDRGVIREHRLDDVAVEPGGQKVVGALRHQIDDAVELAADAPMPPKQRRRVLEAAPVAPRRIDRRFQQERADDVGRLCKIGGEFRIDLGVVAREPRELGLRLVRIVAVDQVVVAVERTEQVVRRQHLEAEPVQLQLGDDTGMQQAHHVGKPRCTKAGREFLGHCGAAEDGTTLQHQHLESRLGEVSSADKAVMSAADDQRVVACGHAVPPANRASRQASAAFRPCSVRMRLNSSRSGPPEASIRISVSTACNSAWRMPIIS